MESREPASRPIAAPAHVCPLSKKESCLGRSCRGAHSDPYTVGRLGPRVLSSASALRLLGAAESLASGVRCAGMDQCFAGTAIATLSLQLKSEVKGAISWALLKSLLYRWPRHQPRSQRSSL